MWIWKLNELPREVKNCYEGKVSPWNPWVILKMIQQLMAHHSSRSILCSLRIMLFFIINISIDNVHQHISFNKFSLCFFSQRISNVIFSGEGGGMSISLHKILYWPPYVSTPTQLYCFCFGFICSLKSKTLLSVCQTPDEWRLYIYRHHSEWLSTF